MSCRIWGVLVLALLSALTATAADKEKKCTLQQMGELPVTMSGTRPLIAGTINGQPARFLADSGAFFSMLTPDAAEKHGLKLGSLPPNIRVLGTGGVERMQLTKVQKFSLAGYAGGRTFENVDFLVGGNRFSGEIDGIIGQNLIGQADTEYDLANGFLRLFRAQDCKGALLAYWSAGQSVAAMEYEPTTLRQPHFVATARLNGKKIRVMFDSGASVSFLTLDAAARVGIEPEDEGVQAAGLSHGIGRKATENFIARFDSLDLGGEVIRNARLRMGDIHSGDGVDMLLGADFFLSHRIYVDSKLRKIYFTYNGGPVFDLRRKPQLAAMTAEGAPSDAADETPVPASEPASAAAASALSAADLRRRGAASAARRDYAAAIVDLDAAVRLDPADAENWYQRGVVLWQSGKPLQAVDDFTQTLSLQPDHIAALMARGTLRLQSDGSAARADFDKAVSLAPDDAALSLQIARALDGAGKRQEAIAALDAWVARHPKDDRLPGVLNQRCWLRAMEDLELPLALADCDAAIKQGARNSATYDSRALVHLRMGNYARSLDDYERALKLQPKEAWSLYGRGLARIRLGRKEQGDADIEAATAIDASVARRYIEAGLSP
ncbi:MAG TPA: tetratricopeptide repeat protein [Povalibacter sp.]|uniref:aspartyl protease family protein n=1 Tax=Povalibacter sp. TaxID=1962978 RepID=UPI002B930F8C|nr:aspartyl protease family protein [Povalibacter sp.]HMN45747.1 tetratricopeptide repeat protein [Povalibacter sp.]